MEHHTESRPRKLIRLGDSTALTLPPEFIRKNNLKPGDTVGVTYDSIILVAVPRLPQEVDDNVTEK